MRSCIRPLVAAIDTAAGRYGYARSEADQQTEFVGSSTNTAFSDPDIVDPLPLQFSDLLTLPQYWDELAGAEWKAQFSDAIAAAGTRYSSFFVIMAQRPRAILLASAIATTMRGFPARMHVSQPLFGVPNRSTA